MSQPLNQKMGVRHGLEPDVPELQGRPVTPSKKHPVGQAPRQRVWGTPKLAKAQQVAHEAGSDKVRAILALALLFVGLVFLVWGVWALVGYLYALILFGAYATILGVLLGTS